MGFMSGLDTGLYRLTVQPFNFKVTEEYLDWNEEEFKRAEERKLIADAVDDNGEVELPKGL
jgi:hypothetical protein